MWCNASLHIRIKSSHITYAYTYIFFILINNESFTIQIQEKEQAVPSSKQCNVVKTVGDGDYTDNFRRFLF